MLGLKKNRLLLLPFLVGIILIVYSWYLSYPLSVDSPNDFLFSQISVFYWLSLPFLLTSMYLIMMTSSNNTLKWAISVGFVMTLSSLSLFFCRLPGSDSHYFTGLTEYFVKTESFDPSQAVRLYFQWPSFFILAKTVTALSGFELANFQFLLFAFTGFLFGTTLYTYASKTSKNWGFLIVPAFFVSTFLFLNLQVVPFTLSLGIVFLMFMLESRRKNPSLTIIILVLFVGTAIMHAFVPLFFVLYLLMRSILNRNRQYFNLFLCTSLVYLLVQFTLAPFSFAQNIRLVITSGSEFANVVQATVAPVSPPIDAMPQMMSRVITIAFIIICSTGFLLSLIRRKSRNLDKAIFLTGTIYSVTGIVFYVLGSRAIALAFLPLSFGAVYLFETKLRPYLACVVLVLLILFPFVSFHSTFTVIFQTGEEYSADNFFIDNYNWTNPGSILANFRVVNYLASKQSSEAYSVDPQAITEADTILYSIRLGKQFLELNYSMEKTIYEEKLDMIYNNGLSYVVTRSARAR